MPAVAETHAPGSVPAAPASAGGPRVGMVQSNYIPWRGYFDFIDDCDLFVFYDDVQYTHKDWRNRNRIKTADGLAWLSVPVRHDRDTRIDQAYIAYDTRWVDKHVRSLTLAYARAPYFERYGPDVFAILRTRPDTISRLNTDLIGWAMARLGITTRTLQARDLRIEGDKHARPLRMLQALGAGAYLTGPTALAYTPPDAFRDAGIALEAKRYDYVDYPQLHGPFAGAVSVLDLLFNTGDAARTLMKSTTPNERIA